jgi:hypothetical protein
MWEYRQTVRNAPMPSGSGPGRSPVFVMSGWSRPAKPAGIRFGSKLSPLPWPVWSAGAVDVDELDVDELDVEALDVGPDVEENEDVVGVTGWWPA